MEATGAQPTQRMKGAGRSKKGYLMKTTTNGSAGSTPTRGYLGHHLPDWERVALAVEHYEQGWPIAAPTLAQLSFAYRVPLAAVQQARNEKAKRTLANSNGGGSLAEHLLHATPTELIEAGQAFGIGRLWDLMIVPNIGNGKTAE